MGSDECWCGMTDTSTFFIYVKRVFLERRRLAHWAWKRNKIREKILSLGKDQVRAEKMWDAKNINRKLGKEQIVMIKG